MPSKAAREAAPSPLANAADLAPASAKPLAPVWNPQGYLNNALHPIAFTVV